MKILFVISNLGEGKGGHFHSLNHLSAQLSKDHICKIITIGDGKSPVIFGNPFFFQNVTLLGFNYIKFLKKIKEIVKTESPDIIHFFDVFSYNLLSFGLNEGKYKICITKCGGPNPRWFPFVSNIILFSLENKLWFEKKNKFKRSNIIFIPNRVKAINFDNYPKPIKKEPNDFNFVRICRIGRTYFKSIEDSIRLVDLLRYKGYFYVKLFIIGAIEDQKVYEQIKAKINNKSNYIFLYTSPDLTKEASKMLYLADAVLGTGRGVMEAASLNIPLLSFINNDNLPILIDSSNFNELFRSNFSERGTIENFNRDDNISKIEKLLNRDDYYSKLSLFSGEMFKKFFSVENVNEQYNVFYNNALSGGRKTILDRLYALRHIILFMKRSNKKLRR